LFTNFYAFNGAMERRVGQTELPGNATGRMSAAFL